MKQWDKVFKHNIEITSKGVSEGRAVEILAE